MGPFGPQLDLVAPAPGSSSPQERSANNWQGKCDVWRIKHFEARIIPKVYYQILIGSTYGIFIYIYLTILFCYTIQLNIDQ